jgi:hypothetical protein
MSPLGDTTQGGRGLEHRLVINTVYYPTSYTNIRPIAVFQDVLPLVAAPNHIDKTDL